VDGLKQDPEFAGSIWKEANKEKERRVEAEEEAKETAKKLKEAEAELQALRALTQVYEKESKRERQEKEKGPREDGSREREIWKKSLFHWVLKTKPRQVANHANRHEEPNEKFEFEK